MDQRKHIAILVVNTLVCALILAGTAVFLNQWHWMVLTVGYGLGSLGLVAEFVFYFWKKEALFKLVFVVELCVLVVLALIIVMNEVGNLDSLSDDQKMDKIKEMIQSTGGWGMFVYVLIQILQVVVLPLPAILFYVTGTALYGAGLATLLASIGVVLGSVIAFFIGKVFGRKVVVWIVGAEMTDKYARLLGEKGKVLFILMQILPFFPDDILCMVAGLTSMSYGFFIAVMVLVRPAIIAVYCFLGGGDIIPFSGWGIYVWIAIFVVCAVILVLYWKYQAKIETWFFTTVLRGKIKRKNRDGEKNEQWRTKHVNTDQAMPAAPAVDRPERSHRKR